MSSLPSSDKDKDNNLGGIFLFGVTTGIVLSYSGFLGFFTGLGSGIFVCSKYTYISTQLPENITYYYQSMCRFIMESMSPLAPPSSAKPSP